MLIKSQSKLNQIHVELRRKILAGEWKVGDRLPTGGELAKSFGCGIGTISKAFALLAHEGLVEQRTKAGTRVLMNSVGRRETGRQLDAYAFIYPVAQHEGISRVMHGFQEAAQKAGKRALTLSTDLDFSKEMEYIARLSEFDVCGAAVCPLMQSSRAGLQLLQAVLNSKFPIVLVDVPFPGFECPTVMVDDFHAGYVMAGHLIERGAKTIGFVGNNASSPGVFERYRGYVWALQEAGMDVEKQPRLLEPTMHADFSDPVREPTELARHYLEANRQVEGVVCANDHLAIGMITAARQMGYRIPNDIKITGIDDSNVCVSGEIAITSYHSPSELIGMKALEVLESCLNGGAFTCKEHRIRGHLIARQSS